MFVPVTPALVLVAALVDAVVLLDVDDVVEEWLGLLPPPHALSSAAASSAVSVA
ncbi:MAG: hypothetical protein WB698_15185 [Solirubrobacteraceae bacterium]